MPKDYEFTGYHSGNLNRAKRLRREMTKEERLLWYGFLKSYPVHFYRQRPLDRYIVDFYCSAAGLVVELDGDQHGEPSAIRYDQARTKAINSLGLEVLRFANSDVTRSLESVCVIIHKTVKQRLLQKNHTEKLAELSELDRKWEIED